MASPVSIVMDWKRFFMKSSSQYTEKNVSTGVDGSRPDERSNQQSRLPSVSRPSVIMNTATSAVRP